MGMGCVDMALIRCQCCGCRNSSSHESARGTFGPPNFGRATVSSQSSAYKASSQCSAGRSPHQMVYGLHMPGEAKVGDRLQAAAGDVEVVARRGVRRMLCILSI